MGSVTSLTASRPSLPLTVLIPATLASLLALQAPVSGPLYLLFLQPRTLVPGHPGLCPNALPAGDFPWPHYLTQYLVTLSPLTLLYFSSEQYPCLFPHENTSFMQARTLPCSWLHSQLQRQCLARNRCSVDRMTT